MKAQPTVDVSLLLQWRWSSRNFCT